MATWLMTTWLIIFMLLSMVGGQGRVNWETAVGVSLALVLISRSDGVDLEK
jgi:hypothetical protein